MKSNRVLVGAVPVAAVAGGLTTFFVLGGVGERSVTAQSNATLTADQRNVAASLEGAFMRIADTVGPATVSIEAEVESPTPQLRSSTRGRNTPSNPNTPAPSAPGQDGETDFPFGPQGPFQFEIPPRGSGVARGSGVIVRADGYILTNDHVVENARDRKVKVTLSDKSVYSGTVMRDPRSDLAVVKIDAGKPLPFVGLADSERLRVGQWAIAIGSPFGQQNTVTSGIVSALHRKREISDDGTKRPYPDLIQTDASINPGNSGGPLLNINGDMIGINVAIYSPTGTSLGIGYAIPANTARYVMEQLISKGKVTRGSLGIVPDDVPTGLRKKLGTDRGAYVTQVFPETPAEKAGIQPGDVITKLGTRDVVDEASLREAAGTTAPGTQVDVTLLRDGKSVTVAATLTQAESLAGDSSNDTVAPAARTRPAPIRQFGFVPTALSTEALAKMKLDDWKIEPGTKGVLVEAVQRGGIADDGGLEPGDVITSIDGTAVETVEALNKAMRAAKSDDVLTLQVLRFVGQPRPGRAVVNITIP